ncbi:hypothetical protein NYO67_11312 [Aspergillus flavus]|nr:hypothetical protein NYO67_11312 [Aspergillus flavus]
MRLPSVAEVLVARQAAGARLPLRNVEAKIHVLPPTGRIGDPCAHYNDPETGWFHVQCLYNGTGIAGVQTDDLVYYLDINENGNYTIVAGGANDPLAVFDGSVIPSGIDDKPTLLYTSVSHLPIHWTLPYTRGSESQSLAVTYGGGHNFKKLDRRPNKDLDDTVGSSSGTWYAAISGGVHDVGPGVFLYRNQGSGYEDWEYLGKWWSEPVNSTCGNGDWAKAWGYNFEVGNVFSLDKEGYYVNGETFITLGVEGSYVPITESVTSMHGMLWASGNILKPDGGNVTFEPTMAGVLDWGISSYAAAGKVLPATSQASEKSGAPDRFISYVWLTGDVFGGVAGYPSEQQGWQNTLLLPRELHKQTISNVVDNDLASETGSWCVKDSENSCLKLETMGIKIARETYKAMTNKTSFTEPKRTLSEDGALSFPKSARDPGVQAGFKILSSELESTTIYYQFSNESIVIGRSNTSAAVQTTTEIDTTTESGRLRLFDINKNCNKSDDDGKQEERKKKDAYREHGRNRHNVKLAAEDESHIETLDLTIVVDNAVLEVYANSRFALSNWARTWYANSTEISFFHNGEGEVTFSDISVSDGLYDAYPDRAR